MRRQGWITVAAIAALMLAAPAATAHEHYTTDDGKYSITLGEQNEPVYTYDWTNLDLIVHENETGGPVPDVHQTVNATLIAPGGEELSLPIEPQFGEKGRYEFAKDYFLTQPGQYEVRLDGHINGTDVNGTYKLPGPRESMSGQGFPAEDVPTLLDLQSQIEGQSGTDTAELEQKVSDLEQQVAQLEQRIESMENEGGASADQQSAPGAGALAAMFALAGVAGLTLRRRD